MIRDDPFCRENSTDTPSSAAIKVPGSGVAWDPVHVPAAEEKLLPGEKASAPIKMYPWPGASELASPKLNLPHTPGGKGGKAERGSEVTDQNLQQGLWVVQA